MTGPTPGGCVILPAGTYYFATPFNQTVCVRGAGIGTFAPSTTAGYITGRTNLIYNGPAGVSGDAAWRIGSLTAIGAIEARDFVVRCQTGIETCVDVEQAKQLVIRLGASDVTTGTGNKFVVRIHALNAASSDIQDSRIDIAASAVSDTTAATVLTLDHDSGSTGDPSDNPYIHAHIWYGRGDGIVGAAMDNNFFAEIRAQHFGTFTSGSPVVMANSEYVPPNGLKVGGATNSKPARGTIINMVHAPLWAQGFEPGTTISYTGTGTARVTPIATTTASPTTNEGTTLHLADATGVAASLGAVCGSGGVSSGVIPYTKVNSIAGNDVVLSDTVAFGGNVNGIAAGVACNFTYRWTAWAVSGTYTLTSTDGAGGHWDITAPSGGTSQTGVATAGGILTFTDITLPISGTPVVGDTIVLTNGQASVNTVVRTVDVLNTSDPGYGGGATGMFQRSDGVVRGQNAVCQVFAASNKAAAEGRKQARTHDSLKNGGSLGCNGGGIFYSSGSNAIVAAFGNAAAFFWATVTDVSNILKIYRAGPTSSGFMAPHIFQSIADQDVTSLTDTNCLSAVGPNSYGTKTLQGSDLNPATEVRLRCEGPFTTTASAVSVTPKLKFAAQVIIGPTIALPLNAAANSGRWWFDVRCTVRSLGASGSLQCGGLFHDTDPATGGVGEAALVGTKTLDTTMANTFNLTLALSATPVGMSMTASQGFIDGH